MLPCPLIKTCPDEKWVGHSFDFIEATQIRVRFSFTEGCPGRLCYAQSANPTAVSYTLGQNDNTFATHAQTVSGLMPDTEYLFIAQSHNGDGIWKDISCPFFQSTDEEADTLEIANYVLTGKEDHDEQMSGRFYGLYEGGAWKGGNSNSANEHSRRFRARCSGFVDAFMWQNRKVVQNDVDTRNEQVYVNCRNAGLTAAQCTIWQPGNFYTKGSGGHYVMELRRDLNGVPDESPAGLISQADPANPFIPISFNNTMFNNIPMLIIGSVVEGQIYHWVWKNINPMSASDFVSTAAQAAATNVNANYPGKVSFNGNSYRNRCRPTTHVMGKFDPVRGSTEYLLYRENTTPGSPWAVNDNDLGWYSMHYQGGQWVGDTLAGIGVGDNRASRTTLSATNLVRSEIIPAKTKTVTGLWVDFLHDGRIPNGGDGTPMTMRLFENGTLLETGTYPWNAECAALNYGDYQAANPTNFNRFATAIEFYRFTAPITLTAGNTYHVEFSAPESAAFVIDASYNLDYQGALNRDNWLGEEFAQFSTNGGNTWTNNYNGNFLDNRVHNPLLFTVEGCPEALY